MAVKKRKPAKKKKKVPILPSVRLYRRIAAAFLTLTMVMLAVVLDLATVQAVISVETQEEGVEREFIARVMEEPQGSEDIPARIFSELVERSKSACHSILPFDGCEQIGEASCRRLHSWYCPVVKKT